MAVLNRSVATFPQPRRTPRRPQSLRARAAASTTAAMGVVVAIEVGTGGPLWHYDLVIAAAVLLCTGLAAATMWRRNYFESRLVAVVIATLTLAGEVLDVTVGRPGGMGPEVRPEGILGGLLAVAALGLIAADARRRTPRDRDRLPYAL